MKINYCAYIQTSTDVKIIKDKILNQDFSYCSSNWTWTRAMWEIIPQIFFNYNFDCDLNKLIWISLKQGSTQYYNLNLSNLLLNATTQLDLTDNQISLTLISLTLIPLLFVLSSNETIPDAFTPCQWSLWWATASPTNWSSNLFDLQCSNIYLRHFATSTSSSTNPTSNSTLCRLIIFNSSWMAPTLALVHDVVFHSSSPLYLADIFFFFRLPMLPLHQLTSSSSSPVILVHFSRCNIWLATLHLASTSASKHHSAIL